MDPGQVDCWPLVISRPWLYVIWVSFYEKDNHICLCCGTHVLTYCTGINSLGHNNDSYFHCAFLALSFWIVFFCQIQLITNDVEKCIKVISNFNLCVKNTNSLLITWKARILCPIWRKNNSTSYNNIDIHTFIVIPACIKSEVNLYLK